MNNNNGFTLVELLVAMAAAFIVMAGVYYTFHTQHSSYITQEQLTGMQQNIRSAMYFMEKEIRMAGCDPTSSDVPGLVAINANSIQFTMDLDNDTGDGVSDGDVTDTGENITYAVNANNQITRDAGGGAQPLADNIDALNFYFLDTNGVQTGALGQVRSVLIALVARTGMQERGYRNNDQYRVTLPDGTVQVVFGPANDGFRRKLLTTVIKCRNLGM